MAGKSNTSRTLEYLRAEGLECGIVERFNQYGGKFGIRQDLFGIIDIIAIAQGRLVGVQSCGQAFSEHDKKIMASEFSLKWIEAGGELVLIGWRKVKKKRGGKQMIWKPRVKEYSKLDFYKIIQEGKK